jgi:hypothetical protein
MANTILCLGQRRFIKPQSIAAVVWPLPAFPTMRFALPAPIESSSHANSRGART